MNAKPLLGVVGLAGAAIAAGQLTLANASDVSSKGKTVANVTSTVEGDLDLNPEGGIPDVIVWEIFGFQNYSQGSMRAYAIGTTSCNTGDVPLAWFSNTNQHPVIGQNMFRLAPGANGNPRFEQVGQAWLKHGFCALSQTQCGPCQATNCNTLGVGCSDPYSAGLNGSQFDAGPKWQVNATTGFFPYPPSNPSWNGNVARRLQVPSSDVQPSQNPGATYFVEAQYVCPDENPAISITAARNNTSWRQVNLNFAGSITGYSGSTQMEEAAIEAWKNADAEVMLTTVTVPDEGTIYVASRAYDNGDGTYDYEYAVQNLDVHRSVGTFTVPVASAADVSGEGFADVDYHSGEPFSGTDWASNRAGDELSWATQTFAQNANANAIRWGTLYNFRFTSDAAPADGDVELGMFRPGAPDAVMAAARVPGDVASNCPADVDNSGAVDFNDIVSVLSAWGDCDGCPQDIDNSGAVDFTDLVSLLSSYGPCP
ncbi:MAG: hypothetical protein AB8G96_09110 [Phycisphaerales bacterium]